MKSSAEPTKFLKPDCIVNTSRVLAKNSKAVSIPPLLQRILVKTYLLIALSFFSIQAFAQEFDTCCVCVADDYDSVSVMKECQKWFTLGPQRDCQNKTILPTRDDTFNDSGKSCHKVKIWGAFHGLSYYHPYPFNISKKAALNYSAKEVTYDGSTCMIFNNVEVAKLEAQTLADTLTDVHFMITGNQNEGVVGSAIPLITKPKELPEQASKVTYELSNKNVIMSFANCTPTGKLCGYSPYDMGATNDSNKKTCMDNGAETTQSCCSKSGKSWGKWSAPGQICGI